MAGQNDTVTATKRIFERARWMHLAMECNAAKNRLSSRSGYSSTQRVFGIGHRLSADLTSDDIHARDPIYDLAATDASCEESRQIREAAMKAHAEVSIRDRIEDAVRARPRTQTVLRADDVIMVWKTNPPSKRGRWVGPGVCVGTHFGSVWLNMRANNLPTLRANSALLGRPRLLLRAARFSASWQPRKSPEVLRCRTNCWMT